MLESKILVESRDLNALSLSVLSLTHLLYPLQVIFLIFYLGWLKGIFCSYKLFCLPAV